MDMPAALTRQVGPWPLWGWLGIGAAGIGAGLLLRRSGLFAPGGDDDGQADEAAEGAGPPTTGYLVGPTLVSGGRAPAGDPGAGPATPPAAGPATNVEWSRQAITWLIARGVTPSTADSAVRKYLLGVELDDAEARALDLVLASPLGPPPEGAPPVDGPPPPDPIRDPTDRPLAAPGAFHAVGVTPTTVMLTWHTVPGAVAYEARRDGGPWHPLGPEGKAEIPAPADLRDHTYEVRAVGPNGARGPAASDRARTITQAEYNRNLRRLAGQQ